MPDELAQNVSNKILFRAKISYFSFESSESYSVFIYVHDSNSIFRAAGINYRDIIRTHSTLVEILPECLW